VRRNVGNLPPQPDILPVKGQGMDGENEMTEQMPDGINRHDVLMGRIMIEKIKNNGWISVRDKLPEDGHTVLVVGKEEIHYGRGPEDTIIGVGYYDQNDKNWCGTGAGGYEFDWDINYKTITHWMPLPEPPND
jgi:hypothetical protein